MLFSIIPSRLTQAPSKAASRYLSRSISCWACTHINASADTPSSFSISSSLKAIFAEPVWDARQQTYKVPQNTAFQNQPYQQQYQQPYQQNKAASPWATPQHSAPVQQFQDVQRPWGEQTQGNQPRAWGDTSRHQPNNYQWGVPVGGGYYERGSDPYGATQGAGYPGYVR